MKNIVQTAVGKFTCYRWGDGPRLMIALHGYDEQATSFAPLATFLGNEYTISAPDLPFHGETTFSETFFSVEDLFKALNTIVPLSVRKITLLGFSMGGRMALAFAQQYPDCIEKLILIAPDGLHKNFWYRLATQNKAGNKLFAYIMNNPGWLFNLMKIFHKVGLLNKSIFKFSHYYLDDANARQQLYKRWIAFKNIKPSVSLLKQEKRFKTLMIFGKYDRIILPKIAETLAKQNECIRVKVVQAGHQLIAEKHSRRIAELIMKES